MNENKFMQPIATGIIIISIGVLAWMVIFRDLVAQSQIESGQTYETILENDNPFEKPMIRYSRVLDMQNGYVLYVDSVTQDTMSSTARTFMWDAKLVSND